MSIPRSFALLLTLACACSTRSTTRAVFPQPTEDFLGAEAEKLQTPRRKAWFEHRHQAGPGVDWRALERANGEAQIEKRNRLGFSTLNLPNPWVERGSENLAGRVHTAALAPDGQSLYVGTSLGGVWEGTLDGTGWTPFGDNLYGGVHHLALVSGATGADPDVALVTTDGGLVHLTRDRGLTWQIPTGLGSVSNVRRVLTTSDGSEIVFMLRKRGTTYELMRSTDALASFQEVYDLGSFAGDAWTTRDGRTDLYVLARTGIKKSIDLGDTWTSVGPAPVATGSQAELAGSEAGAPRFWAVWATSGVQKLYRSDDAGLSWAYLRDVTDYWNVINASIVHPDVFMWGGVETHRTFDAGASFGVINTWQAYYNNPATRLHADIQGIDVVQSPGGEVWYVSTDGGLYRSTDLLSSVQNLSLAGLRVSQYYSTHTSSANPLHVIAGAQDQGYQRASAAPPPSTSTLAFNQLISGDYGHLTSGDGDHGYLFSVYPGFVLVHVGENNPLLAQESFPSGEDHAWMPPVVADPLDARHFFLCASRLYRYTKSTSVNNWTPALWSTFDFGVSANEYVSALVFSPVDPQRAYAVTDRGRLYRSADRGVTWTQSTTTGPSGQYFYGTALHASRTDVDTVYVGGSGYSGPAIYRSLDGGVSFQSFSTGLPPTLVYCLGESPDGKGKLFCGTETAAYARDASASSWVDVTGAQAPITIYWSVEALPHENTMRFGTYGRGIWDYRIDRGGRTKVQDPGKLQPAEVDY